MSALSRFLYDPDLLLEERPHPAGDVNLCLEIPGGPFLVEGLSPAMVDLLAMNCSLRSCGEVHRLPRVSVYWCDTRHFRDSDEIDWTEFLALDYRAEEWRTAGFRWIGRIRGCLEEYAEFWIDSSASRTAQEDAWENFLRILVAYRLFEVGGLLLHSAAVADNGGAWLFPGASGDGKSTLAGICRQEGRLVLSDDCNAVLAAEGGCFMLVGLPFGGEMRPRRPSGQSWPLAGIAALAPGDSNEVSKIRRGEAMALLMRCTPFVNGDPSLAERLMDRILGLLGASRVYRLRFSLDGDFWNLLEALKLREES